MTDAWSGQPSTAPNTEPGWRFGVGAPLVVSVPSPATGSGWVWTVPQGLLAVVAAVTFTLTTDATAATRTPYVAFYSANGTLLARTVGGVKQAASLTATYTAYQGGTSHVTATGVTFLAIPELLLPPGSQVKGQVGALAAGDKLGGVVITGRLV